MGEFHCPMGAAFYDDDDCINCEMCSAETDEQKVEASKKIRDYLKSHAPTMSPLKKIAVCGKGGVGKSTVVVLIANVLRSKGFSILVLDTDESNPGLSRLFGFDREPKPLITLLSRFSTGDRSPDAEWLQREQIAIPDIPAEYVLNRDGLKFMMVGKIQDPFQGCACSMADMTRDLMGKLVLADKEIALVDMEAGIESFGRGVERNMDTVLVIVEPSYESMTLAEKIVYMAQGMGIVRVKAILNKVPSEKVRERMIEELSKKSIQTIGTVYFDLELNEAGFEGTVPGGSRATKDIQTIIEMLLSKSE
ncbi:MAG: P-loop NTPase [Dehalococcoidales bacterium]|nr:P-loop NTPase [Dehalococcoidales bacterium]